MTSNAYNEDSIQQLSGLEHIRHRTSGYLVDTGILGIRGSLKELIDNSVDELSVGTGHGLLDVVLFINEDKSSFQAAVIDNGRGIPIGKLIDVFVNTMTSGKFDTSSYKFSAGSFGVGASVSVATASWFRAITLNRDNIGDVTIKYDAIPTEVDVISNLMGRTGTIVLLEPDPVIFTGISEFANDYSALTEYLIQLSLFGEYRIRLNVVDCEIPANIRAAQTMQLIEYLDLITAQDGAMYDSRTLDRDAYIQNYFNMPKRWNGIIPIKGSNPEDTLRLQGDILIATVNVPAGNTKLTLVNDILFTDNGSIHISLLNKFIKDHLISNISDKAVRTFFVEQYKLPIWLVLDIKYAGAVFSGMAKTSFRDISFKQPYLDLLKRIFTKEMLQYLYDTIAEHIVVSYNRIANSEFKNTSNRHISSMLARPSKFNNCSTNNRSEAELFLIEGDSAKSDQDRDSSFQASYTLSGKPINCLTEIDKLGESVNAVKKNLIFQDIIRILNIVPGSTDLSTMNFGKVLIMADADTHGYHISNILISNLYAICPALIEQGKIYLVKAPLYSLRIKDLEPIYVRDEVELNATLAYQVYHRCIDIDLVTDYTSHTLSREELVVFSEIISTIGDEIERMSKEYMIPAMLLEQLSLMTNALHPASIDIDYIRSQLGCDVKYVSASNLLVVSLGTDDVIVPLTQIADLIYQRILPLYRKIYYGKSRILITTKNTTLYNKAQVSIVMLNMIFKQMGSIFTIKRYKGLGSMSAVDRARTCINPKTRRVYQITSVGDIDQIFAMMGTDSTVRKELILRTY